MTMDTKAQKKTSKKTVQTAMKSPAASTKKTTQTATKKSPATPTKNQTSSKSAASTDTAATSAPAKSLVTPNPAFAKMASEAMARDDALLARIKAAMPELDELHRSSFVFDAYEDGIYRFYHQSWKVYYLQKYTTEVTAALTKIAAPGKPLNPWYLEIVKAGTGKKWERAHNRAWLKHTRPIVEAYFHARYFMGMVRKYGKELENAQQLLPSGWAAVLELYQQR